jgi:NAD(P)-dependent dehydrogenase (short-subunit alcohol dehydrogenase family)
MKTAVITGGTRGLGAAISRRFAEAGYRVVAMYRHDQLSAVRLREELTAHGAEVELIHGDISELDAASRLLGSELIVSADELVLVNNACAAFSPAPFQRTTLSDYRVAFQVDVLGTVLITQTLLRHLLRTRGVVINVLTRAVLDVPGGFAPYIAAKFALLGLTQSLRAEYSQHGLRVFAVAPGFMDTGLTRAWDARLRELYMQPNISSVEEVAGRIFQVVSSPQSADPVQVV